MNFSLPLSIQTPAGGGSSRKGKGKGNLSLRFVRGPKIEVQFNTKISYILKNVLN